MDKIIKILILNNQIEAGLMEEILKEKNIPHIIRSYHDSAYNGIFQAQQGWGSIQAPKKYREKILKIYTDITKDYQ